MDVTTAAAKAVAPSTDDADNAPSSLRAAEPKPAPGQEEPLQAATADMAPLPPTTRATSAEFGDEDEQVEKFYELLANIRTLRAMHARGNGNADASTDDTASDKVCDGVRKRARWAEQPWRPTFRMEDFEEAPGGSAFMKDTRDDEGAATSRWPGKKTTDEAANGESDDA
jgi:hypothetical protein